MYKYGVVVVSYDNELYRSFDEIRNKQMISEGIPFAVIYNGREPTWKMREWEHYVKDERMNPTMYNKFVYIANILLKNSTWSKIDYILRINSSTFLNFKELPRIFSQLPANQCYAGRPLETFPYFPADKPVTSLSLSGVSGMYTVLSKDVIDKLFTFGIIEDNCNDDVALGAVMHKLNIPRTLINDHLININDIPNTEEKYNQALQYTFVRVKNETNRNIDVHHWNELYAAYIKKYV